MHGLYKDQVPLVIGTTGHSAEQRNRIEKAARLVPVVLASNFSIGVNALFALTRRAAEILGNEFDRKIIETHHRMKKDAPSGTAKTIAEILREDGAGEIPIQSVREGEIVGEHTVIFAGPGERLELTHHAESRAIFARGALRAARWIVDQPPGLYSMQDVLGLTSRRRMRAGIALGSNLANRREYLHSAREKILQIDNGSLPFLFSQLYETDPIGCEPGAQKFLNAAMELEYEGEPEDLLSELRKIEESLGRDPDHARNASRTVDLDLLYFGDRTIDREELQLPHPRLHLRRFVLAPLADIRPDLILPGQTDPVRALLENLADNSAVVRVADEW